MRAFSRHVAVGEKLSGLLVIELHGCFLDKFPLVVKTAEEIGRHAPVGFGSRTAVDVERNAEFLERILDDLVVTVHDILWSHSLVARLDGNGHTVLVAAADHEDFLASEAHVAGVDVGRHVDAGEMADMHRSVCIGESRCDESAFETHFLRKLWIAVVAMIAVTATGLLLAV
jgi:hypothetical protein